MKYLKKYEGLQLGPKVDDYVLVNIDISKSLIANSYEIMKFVNNTIGQICKVRNDSLDVFNNIIKGDIVVVYNNVPKEIRSWFTFRRYDSDENPKYNGLYCRTFGVDKIVAFGKTKDEVNQKILSKKFNI